MPPNDPSAFDPFGDRSPFPCAPDVVGTDSAEEAPAPPIMASM